MDTDALRWFQHVADGMTVTEVAEMDMLSQPAISRALARLEEVTGAPLLHKTGRVLRPTQAGNVFKRYVDTALHSLDDGIAALNELVDPETGTVRVSFQQSLGTWLVPGLIERFLREHPRVQFQLEHSEDARTPSPVAVGDVDLEFTAHRPMDADVRWERLFRQPVLLAVPPEHGLADRTSVGLAEVADESFVMLRPSWALRQLADKLCAAAGFAPRVRFECDDLPVLRGFVAVGLGVGIVPGSQVPGRRLGSPARPLIRITDDGASRDVGVAWSVSRRRLPSVELFREFVLAWPDFNSSRPGAVGRRRRED